MGGHSRVEAARGAAPEAKPFIFAQIGTWPCHDNGMITGIRFAQQAALALPNVGMVVAADIGDAAGVMHPVHPPYKQEVARRAATIAEGLVHGNRSVLPHGPAVVSVVWDAWDATWGAFHHGTPAIGSGVCQGTGWYCGGVRVTFDRDVVLRQSYGDAFGFRSGFQLFNDVGGDPALGGTSLGDRQLLSPLCTNCTVCPCAQELDVQGLVGRTLQLNVTFISGRPSVLKSVETGKGRSTKYRWRPRRFRLARRTYAPWGGASYVWRTQRNQEFETYPHPAVVLRPSYRYAWHDYPTMRLFATDGRPVPPFNITLRLRRGT